MNRPGPSGSGERTVRLERRYAADPVEVWRLCTTAAGIESWWGPDGFTVQVHHLDLSVGGTMTYSMRVVDPGIAAYLAEQGMPGETHHEVVFTAVQPYRLLAYRHPVDFVPGVDAYDVGTRFELTPEPGGTRLVLVLDAMHDQAWTDRAVAGWQQELDHLTRAVEEARS
ncbi:MAG TPA: SRPBCC domain-containing protein [Actinotalea sp.]|nr:SRPBCC domain-containing protein [Actinotalea sp.]